MIKIFGRQLFFDFHHLIYDYIVSNIFFYSVLDYELVTSDFKRIDMGYFSIRMLKKVLKRNPEYSKCYLFKTKKESIIVGFALVSYRGAKDIHYRVKDTDAFITALGVFAKQRGRGYSQEILKCLANICRTKGLKTLSLSVDSDNYVAINAYEKFGFLKRKEVRFKRIASIDFLLHNDV